MNPELSKIGREIAAKYGFREPEKPSPRATKGGEYARQRHLAMGLAKERNRNRLLAQARAAGVTINLPET